MRNKEQKNIHKIFISLVLLVFFVFFLFGCSNKEFTVSFFLLNDSTAWMVKKVNKGDFIENIPQPENTAGYIFDGWYLDKDTWNEPFDSSFEIKSNLNVYGRYKKSSLTSKEYTITYVIEGKEEYVEKLDEGEIPQLYIPNSENKVFEGWYLDREFSKEYENKPIDSNLILYGKWSIKSSGDIFNFDADRNTILGFKTNTDISSQLYIPFKINDVLVKKIGDRAFENIKISSLIIDNNIEEIGKSSFSSCQNLSFVTMPESIKVIGASAFEGCKKIENIQLSSKISKISPSTFKNCNNLKSINITNSIKEIGNEAFLNTALINIVIPSSVISIGDGAFQGAKIKNLEFQKNESTLQIGKEAYRDCKELEEVRFAVVISNDTNKNITIGEGCFDGCSKLSIVNLSENVSVIEKSAFRYCTSLNTVNLPENNNNLTVLTENLFLNCEKLKNILIPETITEIAQGCFTGCINLGSINISSKIQKIEKNAFLNCFKLKIKNANELKQLNTIGEGAFKWCNGLEKFYLNESVKIIGKNAFEINKSFNLKVYVKIDSKLETWDVDWIENEEERVFYGKSESEYLEL